MTWKQQENIAYDTKIRYSSWITVAGQAFWLLSFEIIKHIFPTKFPIGILEEFRSHLLFSFRNSGRIFETDTYELFLSPNGYFFDENSDRLQVMKSSRVICFLSQENIAYDTKIQYLWWITVAGQAFWHQVSRLSNIFFRPDFRLEFLKNFGVTSFFRAGILE